MYFDSQASNKKIRHEYEELAERFAKNAPNGSPRRNHYKEFKDLIKSIQDQLLTDIKVQKTPEIKAEDVNKISYLGNLTRNLQE